MAKMTKEQRNRPTPGRFASWLKGVRLRALHEVTLTYGEWEYLMSMNICHYCGKRCFNGIDRIDNELGYSFDNCIPCCKKCNQTKNNFPVEKLLHKLGYTIFIFALLFAPSAQTKPITAAAERYAWQLSSNTSECYFWTTKSEVSAVACAQLKHPTDELSIVIPSSATDLYHTHPRGFPQLSEADKAAQRKSGVRIHVIHW